MKATQQLKEEHEGIKLMLKIIEKITTELEAGKELNRAHFQKIIDFIIGFADKCHHGKEEEILFPALVKHGIPDEGGPIAVMLNEHQQGRDFIKLLSSAFKEYEGGNKSSVSDIVSSSRGYVHLLRNHIEKENNILFSMADRALNEKEQSEMFEAFEQMEIDKIGMGKHEEYHHLLKELKDIYLP